MKKHNLYGFSELTQLFPRTRRDIKKQEGGNHA